MIKRICAVSLAVLLLSMAGCQGKTEAESSEPEPVAEETEPEEREVDMSKIDTAQEDPAPEDAASEVEAEDAAEEIEEDVPDEPTEEIAGEIAGEGETESDATEYRGIVVIDPGHQSQGDNGTEANGPGSSEMKARVSTGTTGIATGKPEYVLNLEVSLKLRDELESRGYEVYMTRETNEVSISNKERAEFANEKNADVFVRVHANGDDDHSVNGVVTICQTASNPYNASLYSESRLLSDLVLDAVTAATGAKKDYVWETDTMTGINWANVPSTIVEMGFMTNAEEDERMSDEAYQYKIAEGIANGVDAYMEQR